MAHHPQIPRGCLLLAIFTCAGLALGLGPPNLRDGGDTCLTAAVIPGLPFSDTGDTCFFNDDYDAACPWAGSGAPDVVYVFTPAADMEIDISLCDSALDTKVYIYAELCTGTPIACNDDACGDDGHKSQLLGVALTAGLPHFIVVDGYGSECGEYMLDVTETESPPDCPPDASFAQPVELDDWHNANSDQAGGFACFESFSGLSATTHGVQWWGTNAVFVGGWFDCEKLGERFKITFYHDAGGAPNPNDVACGPYVVTPIKLDTGLTLGGSPLYHYAWPLLEPACDVTDGWISIVGLDDGQGCWFLWAAAQESDGNSLRKDLSSGEIVEQTFDLSVCLASGYTPMFGACCDLERGTCADEVEIVACMGLAQQFTLDTLCAELDPPCEPVVGACCYEDETCELLIYAECVWPVGDLNCDEVVDFGDINPFVTALMGEGVYYAAYPDCNWFNADINDDGEVNFGDINPFVALLGRLPPLKGSGTPRSGPTWLGPNTTCDQCP